MNLVLKILYLNCVVFYTVFLLLPVSANYQIVLLGYTDVTNYVPST